MPSDVLGRAAEEARRTQVLVFAGGLGKRMGFVPKPKALLEVAGKPLIDWCIEYFAGCGFREFVLLVGKGADEVMRHVGDGGRYGVEVRYSVDPPLPAVGKGKALRHALEEGVVDAGRLSSRNRSSGNAISARLPASTTPSSSACLSAFPFPTAGSGGSTL